MSVNVIWLKRDLRLEDHESFNAAKQSNLPVIVLYVVEPEYWCLPDTSQRQFEFIKQSLGELTKALNHHQMVITIRQGDATTILNNIHRHVPIKNIYSYEETGNDWTFERDKKVAKWCKKHYITWRQFRHKAVVRGRLNRNNYNKVIEDFYNDLTYSPFRPIECYLNKNTGLEFLDTYPGNDALTTVSPQLGGLHQAHTTLESFLETRLSSYLYGISSPIKSQTCSSRLSPYLAYGVLSLRTVMKKALEVDDPKLKRNRNGFISRLHWHSHFVQKFESEPQHEFRAVNRSLDGMRRNDFCETRFSRWREGNTGMPFVDACMRMLNHNGWINFRMRAMLTAFSSYHLWLHWQRPAHHLAQMFVDYEPGIHYPQIQMQSGVTGINPFRIYNPLIQAQKYDPNNYFVRQWVPELDHVPDSFIQQPWLYTKLKEDRYYKIEPPERLAQQARLRIKEYYQQNELQSETQRVIKKHASRRRNGTKNLKKKNTQSVVSSGQQSLF